MSASLTELLAELKKEYLATFPSKIRLIGELWRDGKMVELETEYHKLKGTGRTYGLPEVSQIGEALERLCEVGRSSLPTAVPLSLGILAKIQASREKGEPFPIESDADFRRIIEFVVEADRRAEGGKP